jgi:hypothetical protein
MYDSIATLFSVRTLWAATYNPQPEDPEGGPLTVTPDDDDSDGGGNSGGSSDDE